MGESAEACQSLLKHSLTHFPPAASLPLPQIGFSLLSPLCLIRSPGPRTSFPMPFPRSARAYRSVLLSPVCSRIALMAGQQALPYSVWPPFNQGHNSSVAGRVYERVRYLALGGRTPHTMCKSHPGPDTISNFTSWGGGPRLE